MNLRFAPSPTGTLHIGNFSTMICNYLYSKVHNKEFICRIDDTDINRNKSSYLQEIYFILGIFQIQHITYNQLSEIEEYTKYKNILYSKNLIYFCDCEIRNNCECTNVCKTEGVMVIKSHKVINYQDLEYYDEVYGKIVVKKDKIHDIVISRRNGMYLYVFTNAICDIKYNISTIMRGCDHILNTVNQIIINKALDIKIPKFIHLPLILDQHNSKLSKRSNELITIIDLLKMGYLRSTIINYAVLLRLKYKNEEYFHFSKVVNIFHIKYISRNNAQYSIDKLLYLNKLHLKNSNYSSLINDFALYVSLNNIDASKLNFKYFPIKNYHRYSTLKQLYKDLYCLSGSSYEQNLTTNLKFIQNNKNLFQKLFDLLKNNKDLNYILNQLSKDFDTRLTHTLFRIVTINSLEGIESTSIYELLGYQEILNRIQKYYLLISF